MHLKKAIELDPDFAASHFVLAEVYEASGRKPDALKQLQEFLARSSAHDPRRDEAAQMAAILSGAQ